MNEDLSHLPVYMMTENQLSRYALYMAGLGNRPDLFPTSGYVDKYTQPGEQYEVPAEALADESFAAMLEVAEQFVGYPYVWGGSSPATSFDCSGYLSYILNQCGWDFTTTAPLSAIPGPAIWCSLWAPMIPPAFPTAACIWGTAGCSTRGTPSGTRT